MPEEIQRKLKEGEDEDKVDEDEDADAEEANEKLECVKCALVCMILRISQY